MLIYQRSERAMILPAQLQNFTYLQGEIFHQRDRSASGGSPLVTRRVWLWSLSTPPHPRAAATRAPKQEQYMDTGISVLFARPASPCRKAAGCGAALSRPSWVLCMAPHIHELQAELCETPVSGAQQGRCKINRM